jgi:segregation and condensation protein B
VAEDPPSELERGVEAILFASAEPVTEADLAQRLGADPGPALARLRDRYAGRGVTLGRAGAGWAFRTAPDLAHLLVRHVVETRRLSRAATETLAAIAYHEPVTRAEIEEVRGVAVSRGTIDQLIEMGWVRLGRRRQAPGRPATFVTTEAFLDHFGLGSVKDLPGLAELRAAGFLSGPDGRDP